ncbi:hypothetical protein AYO44_00160 [Planctomycetaceae bacterium SCGC AG-212-F19]|nr:hypothetical protein AYO44_00160 [Planctomycetaceae bacterium SCGC AG-212-F19]
MGHGQQHHSSGESHRRHKDRHARHKQRHNYDAVPVGKPYTPPSNGQPVVGKLVEPPPSGKDWPPRSRRRRSNRFWTATSAITTLAFVLFAVGCMAGGWLLMRTALGKGDVAKTNGKDTGTQVAKANDTPRTDTPSPTKQGDAPKPTETKAPPPPMPDTKAKDPPKPDTVVKPVDPPKPPPDPPKPPPDPPKPADPSVPLVSYDKDIKGVMEARCNRCHGDGTAKPKGNLDTRSFAALIKGGTGGKGVVPGDPKKSSIWMSIEDKEMPPKGEPQLSQEQKDLILNWIKGGAREKAGATVAGLGYEKDVLPMLTQKCGKCHDGIEKSGGLDVTTLATLKKGGGNGAAIVPGDLKKSLLWEYVAITKQMPPEGKGVPLSETEMEKLKNWIMMGAKDNKEAMVVAAK